MIGGSSHKSLLYVKNYDVEEASKAQVTCDEILLKQEENVTIFTKIKLIFFFKRVTLFYFLLFLQFADANVNNLFGQDVFIVYTFMIPYMT